MAQQLKISITILVCSCFNRTQVVLSCLLPPPLQSPNFCLEPSKFCLSATPSNSRNASNYRNNKASNTKRGFPLSCRLNQSRSSTVGLWRRSQARSKQACSGPIHVHGLAKCSPFTIESIYGKAAAACKAWSSWPVFCRQKSDLDSCGFDWPPAGHSPQESCS